MVHVEAVSLALTRRGGDGRALVLSAYLLKLS